MKIAGINILENFTRRWQVLLVVEVVCYTLGIGFLIFGLTTHLLYTILSTLLALVISLLVIKPWRPNVKRSSSFIDRHLKSAEYSTGLFLTPYEGLTNIAKLQRIQVAEQIQNQIKKLQPPNQLMKSFSVFALLIVIGIIAYQLDAKSYLNFSNSEQSPKQNITIQAVDSTLNILSIPTITEQSVKLVYPNYINKADTVSDGMDIFALEGSIATWRINFNSDIKSVIMESMGKDYPMTYNGKDYIFEIPLSNSGFYNFKFEDLKGTFYTSDLYSIEVTKDKSPIVEIKGLDQYTSFNHYDQKIFQLNSNITDDYGIDEAYIVATVSKGTGESVKFREEKLSFGNQVKRGYKRQNLRKTIDLDQMELEPGDELYFYVLATDLKRPQANVSRSETYFAIVKDTTTNTFAVEGTLGVDRMPDYFRSQRQLIIDTEKLIREKKTFTKDIFNFKSNELGYDQKALRLKYAEFMGEETEESVVGQESLSSFEAELEEAEENTDDPLDEYSHKHDTENEHNIVDQNKKKGDGKSENPLQDYTHDHTDPESATLFEESLKTKLLKALGEMWDAELYLRLYKPEESLPYQYRALKYIQEIKNSARIYVHRIGFDPPPIKEDKRLTGKLEDINSYKKAEDLTIEDEYPSMRLAVERIERMIRNSEIQHTEDVNLFKQAGNELAALAIENPGKHLKTLQNLKLLSEGDLNAQNELKAIQKGLVLALPKLNDNANKTSTQLNDLNLLLLKELNVND